VKSALLFDEQVLLSIGGIGAGV